MSAQKALKKEWKREHTLSGDKVSPKKGTNFLWAPAYSPEPPQSSGVLHLVLRDSFLRQPIRFKETFQQPMRIKQSVVIQLIQNNGSKLTLFCK